MTQYKESSNHTSKDQSTKTMPELREGDWVCITCSNLNFAFRTTCNRCKVQTKENNYHQFYNYIIHAQQFIPVINHQLQTYPTSNYIFQQNKQNKENKSFTSALLLTPTKNDTDDTNDTDEPYKSPRSLPSVSPLLKKYNSSQLVQFLTRASISSPFRSPLRTKFEIDSQNLSPSLNNKDEQMNYHISSLLFELDIN